MKPMSKRPYGTGGVSTVGPDRHRIRWRDAAGLQCERTIHGSRAEAERELRAEQHAVETGGAPIGARDVTVADWLETWLALVKPGLAVRSFQHYSHTVHHHLIPLLGRRRLTKLSEVHVASAMEVWRASGASDQAITWRINILRMALGRAVKTRRLTVNVATFVDLPRTRRKRPSLPTDETIDTLLQAIEGHPYELAFALAIGTGMRPGESLALRWRDIDFASRRIDIVLSRIYGTDIIKVTKTEAGDRSVVMPVWLATLLAEHRGEPDAWIVSTRTRRSTDARNILRVMHRLCDELGLPRTNFRMIRHYAITRMLEAGVPMPEVSRAVGHSSISMTVDTYGHVRPSHAIADAMER
jgi:integrase